jgi:MOSC domain-containing protein YiiM
MLRGEFVGEIVRLQVQRVPIKVRTIGYLPDEILAVSRASVDAWGMLGWHEGAWVVDAHNRAHPSRRGGGRRPLSIGFTGHYAAMAERFGDAPIGIAGENVIVDGPPLWLSDLREGLIVELADGELLLERPRVAAPCVEFTSFMLGLDEVAPVSEIEDALADLHDGRRGFIVAADHASVPVELTLGSSVYLSR